MVVDTTELYSLCDAEGVKVEPGDLGPSLRGLYVRHPKLSQPYIGIHKSLDTNERYLRCVLAEEIGHHKTGEGRYLVAYNRSNRRYLDKAEHMAVDWAVTFLVPVDKFVMRVGRYTFEELVEMFFVTPQFIKWQANRLRSVLDEKWRRDPREWE